MDETPTEPIKPYGPGIRRYSPEEKAELVLMGLRNPGKISELCRERHIAPISYSRWKKTFLAGGLEALRKGKRMSSTDLLQNNKNLTELVGKLYLELDGVKKKLEVI